MLDFVEIKIKYPKKDVAEVYPDFKVTKSKDLMIKGGDFYAVWCEDIGLWSTDEDDLIRLVDNMTNQYVEDNKEALSAFRVKKRLMMYSSSGMIDAWHRNCKQQRRDNFHMLNQKICFANTPVNKKDYASIRLPYALEPGECNAYEELISTLYSPEERHKIEWCIGSIVTGASVDLQKFLVFYGPKGSGKSTVINIIYKLFSIDKDNPGYCCVFDAKSLGSSDKQFALESFKNGPLVAIQHDGNLSKIEDNTRLNSLVSHERMSVNEKNKSIYENAFKSFLIMGTNDPVKITNAKSGILRRLIDVSPTEQKVPTKRYNILVKQIDFELGAIACRCAEVFLEDPNFYDNYIPLSMMSATNDFYNFVEDSYMIFKREDSVSLKVAWEMYKEYCSECNVPYPMTRMAFKEELKNYFWEYSDRSYTDDGRIRNVYSKFRTDKFDIVVVEKKEPEVTSWLKFGEQPSLLDDILKDCPAQYATESGIPKKKWDNVTTKLSDIDTSRLHYVKIPENHIVIDFDIPGENGEKDFKKNYEEALKWPETYAELSKSGKGIHLHYIYNGDVSELSPTYSDHVEVKIFSGNSALRRLLSKCNDKSIATISSGLPLKEEREVKVINEQAVKDEKHLRNKIAQQLRKESVQSTSQSMSLIKKILDEAYESGMNYDVSDMYGAILGFAAFSTNSSAKCLDILETLHFKSEEPPIITFSVDEDLYFYDIEVFPNLLLINYKKDGDPTMYRLINPKPKDIEALIKKKLVGFNCRRYDNHIIYAALLGYSNEEIYRLSKRIINGEKGCFFSQAYNISYTDVYDFASNANKMSLKKLEIKMGIHHQELGYDWDQPVPEDKWIFVSEYCDNDVIATEMAFHYLKADFTAREILASLAGLSVNDTTNTLTARIIFGSNKKPQGEFCYRNLAEPITIINPEVVEFLKEACPVMMSQSHLNDGITLSDLPYFPGYVFEHGRSTYKGYEVGEGGFVYAEPGIYSDVALLDVASMHPHSTIAECLFGPKFTRRYREIVEGRVSIKHEAWDEVNNMLNGALSPFIQKVLAGEMTSDDLATALKTAINSVYGLTAAKFDNEFRDKRNLDNIVAKRGALFMINLKEEVENLGYSVIHIKTDSIKIPHADPQTIQYVMDYAQNYGYTFEHEATYDRICLVNDAVYIAKYASEETCMKLYGYLPGNNKKAIKKGMMWTATGTQFAVPYVFKTLFSKEPVIFEDLCEIKSVSKGALYLDFGSENDHDYRFVGRVGQFCPMKETIGVDLMCLRDEKYVSPPGTKGYKWLESEYVRTNNLENSIDISFYENLVEEAKKTIYLYGSFDDFISEKPYNDDEVAPFA